MSIKMDTTNDENGVEAQRDGFFFKRQGATTQSTLGRGGAAPIPYKARVQGGKHPPSPEGGDIYKPRVERPIGSGALGKVNRN